MASQSLARRDLTAPHGRAGDGVAAERGVEVEEDAGVARGVKFSCGNARGERLRAAAADLDVQALRVALGAIRASGAVEGDDLVAEDVVTRGEAGGELHVRGEVLRDHGIRHPASGVAAGQVGGLGDLGERETSGGCGCAFSCSNVLEYERYSS